MNRPMLSQRIKVHKVAVKIRKGDHKFFNTDWIAEEREITGIYVGCRIVYSGRTKTEDYSRWFEPRGNREVWLIAYNQRKNPAHAFPEDCEILPMIAWISGHVNEQCTTCEELDEANR